MEPRAPILFVDDEPAIRLLGKTILEREGHRVLLASDGVEALQTYDDAAGDVACVVLDLHMPGPDGGATLLAFRRLDPDVPAIVMSGELPAVVRERVGSETPVTILRKPFSGTQLVESLTRTIAPDLPDAA